jgi:hypothetical protein
MTTLSDEEWMDAQYRNLDGQRARRSYTDPLAPNPDEEIGIRALSEASGLTDEEVRADPDHAQRAAQGRRASDTLRASPRLQRWIGDPRNGAVARDDVENLSVFERLADSVADTATRYPIIPGLRLPFFDNQAARRAARQTARDIERSPLVQWAGRTAAAQTTVALAPGVAFDMLPPSAKRVLGRMAAQQATAAFAPGVALDVIPQANEFVERHVRRGMEDVELGELAFRAHQAGQLTPLQRQMQARGVQVRPPGPGVGEALTQLGESVIGPAARAIPSWISELTGPQTETAAPRAQRRINPNVKPLTDAELQRIDELVMREGGDDWGPFVIGPSLRLMPQLFAGVARGGRDAVRNVGQTWEAIYGNEDQRREIARRILQGKDIPETLGLAGIGILSTPVAAIGGGYGGMVAFSFEQETGRAYDEMIRAGVDSDIAARKAEAYGATAAAIEFVTQAVGLRVSGLLSAGERMLTGRAAGSAAPMRSALMRVAGTAADQGIEEASQEAAQIIYQDLAEQETLRGASDPEAALGRVFTKESLQRLLHAGYIGAQGGAGFGSVPAMIHLQADLRDAAAADRNAILFKQQAEAARKSRLAEELPSAFESAIGAMDDGEVFIDADAFVEHFQSAGADPFIVADELGIGSAQLEQALAADGQVSMSRGRFVARVLRLPRHSSLADHVRLTPTDATRAESTAQVEVLRKRIEDVAREAQEIANDNELGEFVEARVKGLLDNAYREGGTNPSVNKRYAQMYGAVARPLMRLARQCSTVREDRSFSNAMASR